MGTYIPGLNFPIYSGWNMYTPVIPKLYWDVYSAEQRMKQLCLNFDKVEHYLDYIAELMNSWNIEFTEDMEKQFQEIWDAIHDGYEQKLNEWFATEFPKWIGQAVRMVFFGCTEDGHFTAYIPESWNPIIFDYGADYSNKNTYGHIILEMYVTDTFQVRGKPTDLIWEVQ